MIAFYPFYADFSLSNHTKQHAPSALLPDAICFIIHPADNNSSSFSYAVPEPWFKHMIFCSIFFFDSLHISDHLLLENNWHILTCLLFLHQNGMPTTLLQKNRQLCSSIPPYPLPFQDSTVGDEIFFGQHLL